MKLSRKEVQMAKSLIRFCRKFKVTLQADGGVLSLGGCKIVKVNPDLAHIENPNKKLKGRMIAL